MGSARFLNSWTRQAPIIGATGFDGGSRPAVSFVIPRKKRKPQEDTRSCHDRFGDTIYADLAGFQECPSWFGPPFGVNVDDVVLTWDDTNGWWQAFVGIGTLIISCFNGYNLSFSLYLDPVTFIGFKVSFGYKMGVPIPNSLTLSSCGGGFVGYGGTVTVRPEL